MTSSVTDVMVTELGKISDRITLYCIIAAVVLVILGLAIGAAKGFFRKLFK